MTPSHKAESLYKTVTACLRNDKNGKRGRNLTLIIINEIQKAIERGHTSADYWRGVREELEKK